MHKYKSLYISSGLIWFIHLNLQVNHLLFHSFMLWLHLFYLYPQARTIHCQSLQAFYTLFHFGWILSAFLHIHRHGPQLMFYLWTVWCAFLNLRHVDFEFRSDLFQIVNPGFKLVKQRERYKFVLLRISW